MSETLMLRGRIFGRLKVVGFSHIAKRFGRSYWHCRCKCGRRVTVAGPNLMSRNTRSCGCLRDELIGGVNRTHGLARTPTYWSWLALKKRCLHPVGKDRRTYAGATFCRRWRKFENFLKDMGKKPKGKSIDRFPNPAGNYTPTNCRWATPLQQRHNRRSR